MRATNKQTKRKSSCSFENLLFYMQFGAVVVVLMSMMSFQKRHKNPQVTHISDFSLSLTMTDQLFAEETWNGIANLLTT